MKALRIAPGIQNVINQSEHLPWPPRTPRPSILPPPSNLFVSHSFFSLHAIHSGFHSLLQASQPPPDLRTSVLNMSSRTYFLQHSLRLALFPSLCFTIIVIAPERKATLTLSPHWHLPNQVLSNGLSCLSPSLSLSTSVVISLCLYIFNMFQSTILYRIWEQRDLFHQYL